jgi:hypothetical protein
MGCKISSFASMLYIPITWLLVMIEGLVCALAMMVGGGGWQFANKFGLMGSVSVT